VRVPTLKLRAVIGAFRREDLRAAALRGSVWRVAGYAASSALRLGGNLILTRLLVPEAFGLMALVYATITGLQMFSDAGLRGSIVQNVRGEDEAFLNTAWTIQVVRGFILWGAAVIISWPLSVAFEEPLLIPLLAVTGLTMVFNGVRSIMFFVRDRRLDIRVLVTFQLVTEVAGLVVMILWALASPTIWALAFGGVVSAAAGFALSYFLLGRHRHRLTFEPAAARTLFHFGKWIFVSTLVTFIINQADRFIIAGFTDVAMLGLFSIAVVLALFPYVLVQSVADGVLLAAYARVFRDRGRDALRDRARSASGLLYLVMVPSQLVLVGFGGWLIDLLYDPRYEGAGPMLEIIAAGAIGAAITDIGAKALLATGDSRSQAILQVARLLTFATATAVGFAHGELLLFLVAVSIARWLDYVAAAVMLRRARLWNPGLDLPVLGAAAVVIVLIAL
jgi:O-antigen/teichoic acid export membrane protein